MVILWYFYNIKCHKVRLDTLKQWISIFALMRVGGCRWSGWPASRSLSPSLYSQHAIDDMYLIDQFRYTNSRLWEQSERGWQINNIKAHLTICCSSPTCSLSVQWDLSFCRQNDHVHIIYLFKWNKINPPTCFERHSMLPVRWITESASFKGSDLIGSFSLITDSIGSL